MLTITMQFKSSFYVRDVERTSMAALKYGRVLGWRYDVVVAVQLCGA